MRRGRVVPTHGDSVTGNLPRPGVSPLADAIRTAVGAGPTEQVTITTPQFTRPKGRTPPTACPTTLEEWGWLRTLTMQELRGCGFGDWDGGLALVPGEWHGSLPAGLQLECISGETAVVGRDFIDDDIRFGCLAYGVRVGPATDGVDS